MGERRSRSGAVVLGWVIREGRERGKGRHLHRDYARESYAYAERDWYDNSLYLVRSKPTVTDTDGPPGWLKNLACEWGGRVVTVVDPRTRPEVDQSMPLREGDVFDFDYGMTCGHRGKVRCVVYQIKGDSARFTWTGPAGSGEDSIEKWATLKLRLISRGPAPVPMSPRDALREVRRRIGDLTPERIGLRDEVSKILGLLDDVIMRGGLV